jgi:hypothetical protein
MLYFKLSLTAKITDIYHFSTSVLFLRTLWHNL